MNKTQITIISLLALIAITALALHFLDKLKDMPPADYSHAQVLRDTVYSVIRSEPIIINKVKTKIHKIKDTIIATNPFRAELDTVVQSDTVRFRYDFPDNLMSLDIRKPPDSTSIQRIMVLQPPEKDKSWWENPILILAGVLLGFILGK